MTSQHDELDPRRRIAMRALLIDAVRVDSAGSPSRMTRQRILGIAAGIGALTAISVGAFAIAFTGVPHESAPVLPMPSTATSTAEPTATPTPTPTATATPTPVSTASPASPSSPGPTIAPPPPETPLNAQAAYDFCRAATDPWDAAVSTPQGDRPPAPTISLASFDASDVDEYVDGIWTVVVPVVRQYDDGPRDGIKVCTIQGTVENPDVSVTDSLD